jgi:hypothetical protein
MAGADAKRHGPGFFLGSVGARVRQNLRAGAAGAGKRGGGRGLEEGAGAGVAQRPVPSRRKTLWIVDIATGFP